LFAALELGVSGKLSRFPLRSIAKKDMPCTDLVEALQQFSFPGSNWMMVGLGLVATHNNHTNSTINTN
jgi:hypothetical protein